MNTVPKVVNTTQNDTPVLDINQDPEEIRLRQMDEAFISLLPPKFQTLIREWAEDDGLSIAGYFNPLMAHFSQAAGTWFKIKTKSHTNLPNIYTLTVGHGSTGKSQGEKRFIQAIKGRDNELQSRSTGAEHAFLKSCSHAKMEEVLIKSQSVLHMVGEIHDYLGMLSDSTEEGSKWLKMQLEQFTDPHLKRAFRGDGVHQTDSAVFSQMSNTQPKYFLKLYKYEGAAFPFRFLVYPLTEKRRKIPYETHVNHTSIIDHALRLVYDYGNPHLFDLNQDSELIELVVDYWNKLIDIQEQSNNPVEMDIIGKDMINFPKLILILHIMYQAAEDRPLNGTIPMAIIDRAYKMITRYREAHLWTYDHCKQLGKKGGKASLPTLQQSAAAIFTNLKKDGKEVNISELSRITGLDRGYYHAKNPYIG
jgi:hypothetical protein